MGILNDLLARVNSAAEGLQTGEFIRDVLVQYPGDILELQKIQLFEGKAANGEDIRPYYSEDLKPGGYFYTVESAGRYAAWKKDGINYPYSATGRNPDAPNLYINGRFHDELGVEFGTETVGIVGTTGYAKGIMLKYGMNTFGLMPASWTVIFQDRGAFDKLFESFKQRIYGTR